MTFRRTFEQLTDRRGPDECWPWLGSVSVDGYGQFGDGIPAHREALRMAGVLIAGLEVDHRCRNRPCVNPSHLEAVTPAENKRRQAEAITHCKYGHPLSGPNVRRFVTANGWHKRGCRVCESRRMAEYNRRRNAA